MKSNIANWKLQIAELQIAADTFGYAPRRCITLPTSAATIGRYCIYCYAFHDRMRAEIG